MKILTARTPMRLLRVETEGSGLGIRALRPLRRRLIESLRLLPLLLLLLEVRLVGLRGQLLLTIVICGRGHDCDCDCVCVCGLWGRRCFIDGERWDGGRLRRETTDRTLSYQTEIETEVSSRRDSEGDEIVRE